MKILFIVGSLREHSFNKQLAKQAEELIGDRAEINYLDFSNLPLMNQDLEFPVKKEVQDLRDAFINHDGVWLFSPEYNWSYPGHVKNILDWLSRPVSQDSMATTAKGIKITVSNVAGGFGGANCREKLYELMKKLQMDVMKNPVCGIKLKGAEFNQEKLDIKNEDLEILKSQVESFLNFLK